MRKSFIEKVKKQFGSGKETPDPKSMCVHIPMGMLSNEQQMKMMVAAAMEAHMQSINPQQDDSIEELFDLDVDDDPVIIGKHEFSDMEYVEIENAREFARAPSSTRKPSSSDDSLSEEVEGDSEGDGRGD